MPNTSASSATLTSAHVNRHAWALGKHGHLLVEALREDISVEAREVENLPGEQIPGHLVTLILEKADPTQNKGMTAWLVGQYAQGKLRLEDLGTANETLTMFRRYAPRLEISQRDLGQYPSLAAVWEAVISFANAEEQHISGKAQKALDRDKAYAESRILRQDPDGFTVAVPLTEFAAKWWGRGTRWCTASEKNNYFSHYHKYAPLIIVIIPELKEKGKFQLWATEGDVQFMDAADNSVSEVLITEYWPRFSPVLDFALRQNGRALRYVQEDLRSEEMCRNAAAQNGLALAWVPKMLRDEEMCRFAVAQNGLALSDVPQKLRTDEMCRIAVAQNGLSLRYAPQKPRTEELCRIAVGSNGWALAHVPEGLCTEELCRIAVAQDGRALELVPDELCTEAVCRIAVAQHDWALDYVPEKLRTKDLCRIAVARHGMSLCYVPAELRTEDMCKIAVAQDGRSLQYVPEALRTEEVCRIAVAQNDWALKCVPQDLRTEELCRIAVGSSGLALDGVPEAMRDRLRKAIPPPVPAWDISLLDELVSVLGPASSPAPLETPHA